MTESPYNDLVLDCFNNPRHANGNADAASARQVSAQAVEFSGGPRVRLSCDVVDGRLARVAFSAWGCPHFLAAADLVAEELAGRPVDALVRIDVDDIATRLEVPREKLGKLLRIEDALAACHRMAASKERG